MPVGLSDSFFCAVYTYINCQFGKQEFSGIFPLAGGILSFQNGNSRWPWFGSVRVLTKVRVRFSSSSSQVHKIWVRFGFGYYILSFEFGSVRFYISSAV